jgi:hypothetical protein
VQAIAALNGFDLGGGRALQVSFKQQRPPRP